jgi:hypothetical protein
MLARPVGGTMAVTSSTPGSEPDPLDHYHVEREAGRVSRPPSHHILAVFNGLLLIILAAASLALFWIVATFIGYV